MAELEVGREEQSLRHGDVTPGLEHHHCDGSTGEGVTDDKFGDDAKLNYLSTRYRVLVYDERHTSNQLADW